jgi:aspartokinase
VLGRTLQTFLNTDNVPEAGELAKELSGLDDVTCSLVGLVSAVGYGIGGRLVWMSEAEAALREGGIEPVAVFCQVARLSWVVSTDQVAAAARILHELL